MSQEFVIVKPLATKNIAGSLISEAYDVDEIMKGMGHVEFISKEIKVDVPDKVFLIITCKVRNPTIKETILENLEPLTKIEI